MKYENIYKANKLRTELEKVTKLIELMQNGNVDTKLMLKATPTNSNSSFDLILWRRDAENVLLAYQTCLITNLHHMGIEMKDADEVYQLPSPDDYEEEDSDE